MYSSYFTITSENGQFAFLNRLLGQDDKISLGHFVPSYLIIG